MRMLTARVIRSAAALLLTATLVSCGMPDAIAPADVSLSKGGSGGGGAPKSGLAVTAADPSYGYRGDTDDEITITGSGFSGDVEVAWERGGAADPKITVHSAAVINSTTIRARITIAEDADLDGYDISVTLLGPDRKKGIGTELFEVTTAESIGSLGGNTEANGANDREAGARVVGWSFSGTSQRAFYWSGANGEMVDLGAGNATGIDQLGTTIVGNSGGAAVWTLSGNAWLKAPLPRSADSTSAAVRGGIASDAGGAALFIGGSEEMAVKKKTENGLRPRLWKKENSGWTVVPLDVPSIGAGAYAWVSSVNAAGQAVGAVRLGQDYWAVVWDTNGSWTILPGGAGTVPSGGINAAGTVVAGSYNGRAVFWTAQIDQNASRIWSGPFGLPGTCGRATGISNAGRIVGNRCPTSGGRYLSAAWDPPYDAIIVLRGLGAQNGEAAAWGISPDGSRIVGTTGCCGQGSLGLIWDGGIF